ncbi:MAG: hypothetical protein ACI35S_01400 [Anaeroplasma sp.]
MKNMMIFGGSQFYNEVYNDGKYIISKKRAVYNLMKDYEIDNFSNASLTTRTTLKYIDTFTKIRKYDYCVIALGEGDLLAGISPYEFERNLSEIVNRLNDLNIKTVIVNLPTKVLKKYNALEYDEIINAISDKYHTEYIVNGLAVNSTNHVSNDAEMKRTIAKLCI